MIPDSRTIPYLTTAEVSKAYHIPERTLRNWREKRRGPRYYRFGQTPVYSIADMDEFIASCAVTPSGKFYCCPRPATSVSE